MKCYSILKTRLPVKRGKHGKVTGNIFLTLGGGATAGATTSPAVVA
jgi:hypothetical protein